MLFRSHGFGITRLVPRLLGRFGPKPMALTGSTLMIAGLVWLTRITVTTPYFPGVFGPMVLMGIGAGTAFAPLNVIIMSTVPVENAGSAGGALQTLQQIGGTLGLAVLVTVFGTATRHAAGSPAQVLVTGMSTAFVASVALAACTLAGAATFRGKRGN